MKGDLGEDVVDKLKEVGWVVLVSLLRWLLERLLGGSPDEGDGNAEGKHE
jgi:hypothetical protein